ncbi:hypothetical protein ANN_22523 [Periplaneta americana]|uniref:Uncharacterized protein n=1 Tax=Periplaneta americana TaxID=6978 RepID=A0ABQ8S910_PERAM|nr:hypothetical protein ANN_22523 [Periplaneta americana]
MNTKNADHPPKARAKNVYEYGPKCLKLMKRTVINIRPDTTMTIPALRYGSETWTFTATQKRRIELKQKKCNCYVPWVATQYLIKLMASHHIYGAGDECWHAEQCVEGIGTSSRCVPCDQRFTYRKFISVVSVKNYVVSVKCVVSVKKYVVSVKCAVLTSSLILSFLILSLLVFPTVLLRYFISTAVNLLRCLSKSEIHITLHDDRNEKGHYELEHGKNNLRSKICLYNKPVEQVSCFKYLGYHLSYEQEKDISTKLNYFNYATDIINNIFRPSLVQNHTRIKVYKILTRPVLIYGSEASTIRKCDEHRMTANEMEILR